MAAWKTWTDKRNYIITGRLRIVRRRLFLRTKTDNRGPGATGKRDRGVLLSRYIVLSDAVSVSAIYDRRRPRTLSRPRPRGVVPPVCSGHRVDETAVLANRCEKVCGVSTCFARRHPLARNLSQSVARAYTHGRPVFTVFITRQHRGTSTAPLSPCGLCTDIFASARERLRDARTLHNNDDRGYCPSALSDASLPATTRAVPIPLYAGEVTRWRAETLVVVRVLLCTGRRRRDRPETETGLVQAGQDFRNAILSSSNSDRNVWWK